MTPRLVTVLLTCLLFVCMPLDAAKGGLVDDDRVTPEELAEVARLDALVVPGQTTSAISSGFRGLGDLGPTLLPKLAREVARLTAERDETLEEARTATNMIADLRAELRAEKATHAATQEADARVLARMQERLAACERARDLLLEREGKAHQSEERTRDDLRTEKAAREALREKALAVCDDAEVSDSGAVTLVGTDTVDALRAEANKP